MPDRHVEVDRVLAGPSGPDVVAFFDYDGTVIDGYSIAAFYRRRLLDLDVGPMELLQLVLGTTAGDMDEERFTDLAERAARAWSGRLEEDLLQFGQRLLVESIGASLFPDAWDVVEAHRRMGHRIVLASAASRFQVEPMADELGADAVLCTRFETVDGMLTGRLDGPALWGRRKADAVEAWACEHDIDLARCYAYGNGEEDVPFLAKVGHPRAVNPGPALRTHARQQAWPVVTFAPRGRPDAVRLARSASMYGAMLAASGAGIAVSLLDRNRRRGVDLSLGLMGDLALALAGVDIEVVGREHLWSHRPAVFVFNHQSGIDMPVLMKLIRERFTGIAKAELANVPGLGQFFRWADVAFVERGNTTQTRVALAPVVQKLREGTSIVIAPEGTRSATPRLGRFRKGAFHLAMQAGVPIVPIVLRNAGEVAWRDSLIVRSGTIDAAVLAPIDVSDWEVADLDVHVAAVRQMFLDTLTDWPHGAQRTTAP